MAAPFGNQFWKFADPTKPKKYETPEELWAKAIEYFEWVDKNPYLQKDYVGKDGFEVEREKPTPYTRKELCIFLNITEQTFINYRSNKDPWKDLFEVCTHIEQIIDNQKFKGAAIGLFNHSIIARDLGLADKVDSRTDGKHEIVVRYERKPDNNAE